MKANDSVEGRIYSYRKSAKQLYWLTLLILFLSELIILRLHSESLANDPVYLSTFKLLVASGIPLSIFVRVFFFIRPRIFSTYMLTHEGLVVKRGSRRHEVSIEQIERVRISLFSPRFMGGFSIYLKSGQKLTFLSILDGGHEILEHLIQARPELLDSYKLNQYLRMSQLVDLSWERIRKKLANWKGWILKYVVYPAVIAAGVFATGLYQKTWAREEFVWVYAITLATLVVLSAMLNHVEERIINQRVLVISSEAEIKRDSVFEKRVESWAVISYYVLSLILVIAFAVINWM